MEIRKIISLAFIGLTFLMAANIRASAIEVEEEELFRPIEIKNGMNVTVLECVSAAFQNSPKIRRQKYNLDIAKSNLGIAKSQYFPVISAGAGFYNENNSDNIYYNHHYRELPSVGVSVNKLIWNFGKTTAYIKMEEFYKIGAEYEFMDSLCSTLFDVKSKYYNLLKSKAMLEIAQKDVEINRKYVSISQKSPDLNTAQINLNDAIIRLAEAENNYKNAKIDLDNAMYLDNDPDFEIQSTKNFSLNVEFVPQVFPFSKEEAVDIAYKNSPDLNVLISTKKAMEQSLLYIKRTYLPDLTANAGYGYNNSNQVSNNSFQVGVNLNTSVNLMELRHSIKGADAQVNLADNEIELFKKDLYFEVKRAFNNVEKAEKQISPAIARTKQSIENLALVEDLYVNGKIDYTSLQDAREDYIIARNGYVESLYDYNIALIQVEMALHCHLTDIHHKSDHAVHYHSGELIQHLNKVLNCSQQETAKQRTRKRENL